MTIPLSTAVQRYTNTIYEISTDPLSIVDRYFSNDDFDTYDGEFIRPIGSASHRPGFMDVSYARSIHDISRLVVPCTLQTICRNGGMRQGEKKKYKIEKCN